MRIVDKNGVELRVPDDRDLPSFDDEVMPPITSRTHH
jgi:hypothetical protein